MDNLPERAALFDTAAIAYDRFRPGYPQQLIDDMIGISGVALSSRLLEVGCGTGKGDRLSCKERICH